MLKQSHRIVNRALVLLLACIVLAGCAARQPVTPAWPVGDIPTLQEHLAGATDYATEGFPDQWDWQLPKPGTMHEGFTFVFEDVGLQSRMARLPNGDGLFLLSPRIGYALFGRSYVRLTPAEYEGLLAHPMPWARPLKYHFPYEIHYYRESRCSQFAQFSLYPWRSKEGDVKYGIFYILKNPYTWYRLCENAAYGPWTVRVSALEPTFFMLAEDLYLFQFGPQIRSNTVQDDGDPTYTFTQSFTYFVRFTQDLQTSSQVFTPQKGLYIAPYVLSRARPETDFEYPTPGEISETLLQWVQEHYGELNYWEDHRE